MGTPTPTNRQSDTASRRGGRGPRSDSLADILERVLDSGVVIAGDIRVQLADIELLTIQLRLVVCSVERAEELGMDWWRDADWLESPDGEAPKSRSRGEGRREESSSTAAEESGSRESVDKRLDRMEQSLERLERVLEDHDREPESVPAPEADRDHSEDARDKSD